MKQLGLFIHLFLLNVTVLFSQADTYPIRLPTDKPNFLISIKNRTFYINEIIDSRSDTNSIGMVRKGIGSKNVFATLEGGLVGGLKNYFTACLISINMNETLTPVALEIKEFEISEWVDMRSNDAGIKMCLVFYKYTGQNQRVPFYTAEIDEIKEGLFDITAYHPVRIQNGFTRAFTKMNDYLRDSTDKPAFYSETVLKIAKSLKSTGLKKTGYPVSLGIEDNIRTCSTRRKGIYLTYDEFLANRPSIIDNYVVEYTSDSTRLKLSSASNKIYLRWEYWGFCDGKDIFYNAQNYQSAIYYSKLTEYGTLLAWHDRYLDASDRAVYRVFGVVGLIVANEIVDNDCMIYNTANKKVYKATPSVMLSILKNDSDLQQQYTEQNRQESSHIFDIIKQYNLRHPFK